MTRAAGALLAAALAGCEEPGPLQLDEIEGPTLYALWYHSALGDELDSPRFGVQLSFYRGDQCPSVVAETVATVDDVPLEVTSLGGWVESGTARWCTVPTFRLPGDAVLAHPPAATTRVEISDGATTLGLVAGELFAERGASLEAPASAELVAGQPASLAWRPASDVLGLVAITFHDAGAEDGPPAFVLSGADLEIEGARIRFVVPEVAPRAGTLRVEASSDVATIACDGPRRCSVQSVAHRSEIPVTIR
jgi:hypothetical protein